ncbi:hypothetical protein ACHQM5_000634 [Ranunculus cassubicifolius]
MENHAYSQINTDSNLQNEALLSEFKSLQTLYHELRSKYMAMEYNLVDIKHQRDETLQQNFEFTKAVEDEVREKFELLIKYEVAQEKISELMEENRARTRVFSRSLESVKGNLLKMMDRVDTENSMDSNLHRDDSKAEELDLDKESEGFVSEIRSVYELAVKVESRYKEYVEMRRKEKRELENSVVSLTEENRDLNSLLRIAIVEKDAVEKSLSRLKGGGEQKMALLQFAERGLQKVGFGFIMGASQDDTSENADVSSNVCGKPESSESEEEVVSLASSVEKIIKSLRLEISQLKESLEESRSDNERLQCLTEKQSKQIRESMLYIYDLEERESRLTLNIEKLTVEITEAQEEIERWMEACELEVEASRHAIEEHERKVMVLSEELRKAKTSLNTSNNKIKLKEQLAAAAMAAQEAAQKSLEVADRRATELNDRIESLTRQLEVAEDKGSRSLQLKARHMCWPWRALNVNPGRPRQRRGARRRVPEMQSLLHYII